MQGSGPLFRKIAGKVKALLADRGYGADASRSEIAMHGIQAGDNRQVQPKPSRPFAHVLSRCTASLSQTRYRPGIQVRIIVKRNIEHSGGPPNRLGTMTFSRSGIRC